MSGRLSVIQLWHLCDLLRIEREGSTGEAFWHPVGAEHHTAESLHRRGLLTVHHRPSYAFSLTDKGREIAEARLGGANEPGELTSSQAEEEALDDVPSSKPEAQEPHDRS